MNKKNKILKITIILIILIIGIFLISKTNIFKKKATRLEYVQGITIVPTMKDKLTMDSTWCGTFQLIWNDMKNEVVKKDIVFTPQEEYAENLNKEEFTTHMISDKYYYKTYGIKSLELKNQIINAIKEKFNQKSSILDSIDWTNNANNAYIFYAMLYKIFEFQNEFDKLENGDFANKYNNVKYFGINDKTNPIVKYQMNVLYYKSEDDFAVSIDTKSNDEVIFYKNPQGKTFSEMYNKMNNKAKNYKGDKYFTSDDEFKAPNIKINVTKEYKVLQNKEFKTKFGAYAKIEKALQTIEFSLDEKGGTIKSEAIIDEITLGLQTGKSRTFYVDDTFAIFIKEKNKNMPYFAARIDDITKFQ